MKSLKHISAAAVCVAAFSIMVSPASAVSLNVDLGGGGGGGGGNSGISADANIGGGSVDVDVDLGGGGSGGSGGSGGGLLDLNGTGLGDITADVDTDDGIDARLGIGNGIGATGDLLGSGGNNDVTLDLSGLGLGNIADLGIIDLDLLGGGGGNGGNGGNGGAGGNGGLGGGTMVASAGGGGGGMSGRGSCSIPEGRQVLQLAANGKVDVKAWKRAANVAIVPVSLCASTKSQVAKVFRQSPKINSLQGAVASDPLITASLARTKYDASDVFAVARSNGQLTVYVY